jgi:lantibiotic modifying enzyme
LRTGPQNHRLLLRPTAQYARLLRESCEARNMLAAGERWRRLVRKCCASAAKRRIGIAEARALLRCDIPKFTTRRKAIPASWKQFSAIIAELERTPRLLRRRVLLGSALPLRKERTG